MHTVVKNPDIAPALPSSDRPIIVRGIQDGMRVSTGGMVFQSGDKRAAYRVKEGAIFHYVRWADGSHELIEVAFPGDVVGLGHLSTHVSTAQAMVDSEVERLSVSDVEQLLKTDDRASFQLASAAEREFAYMRDTAINRGKRSPVERLANYLVAVAAAGSGRRAQNGMSVSEDLASGFVADRLDMSLDTLASALSGLEHKGMITATRDGLTITDAAALERLGHAA